jgi:hypothetical protein
MYIYMMLVCRADFLGLSLAAIGICTADVGTDFGSGEKPSH